MFFVVFCCFLLFFAAGMFRHAGAAKSNHGPAGAVGSRSILFPYASATWNSRASVLYACNAGFSGSGKFRVIGFGRAVMRRDVQLEVLRIQYGPWAVLTTVRE